MNNDDKIILNHLDRAWSKAYSNHYKDKKKYNQILSAIERAQNKVRDLV